METLMATSLSQGPAAAADTYSSLDAAPPCKDGATREFSMVKWRHCSVECDGPTNYLQAPTWKQSRRRSTTTADRVVLCEETYRWVTRQTVLFW